jgi:hypothetical protein
MMNRKLSIFLVTGLLVAVNVYPQKNIEKGLAQITPELVKKYVYFLASDSMKGRNTPSPELDKAADYLARELASMGIKPLNGTYFQNIPLCSRNLDVNNCALKIKLGDKSKEFVLKTDYTPFEETASQNVTAGIVFAGYGITAPEYNYDDYKAIDVKGKIVLVLKHEPGEKDPKSPFDGEKDTKYSALKNKLDNARQHGAIGVMVVTDPLNHIMLTPQGFPWASLSKFLPQDNLPIVMCEKNDLVPFVQVGETVIKYLFGSVDSLKVIQKAMDEKLAPFSFAIGNSECELSTAVKTQDYTARNVIGYIEGNDAKLKSELVIIGGHYDHVGYMKKHKEGEDYIYNGADDNASGTAGVLAAAKAFSSVKSKPARSVMFILFAGEEKGLYGSDYYCKNPLWMLDKTVAMLNMDMIGRNGKDSLEIEGEKQNPDLFLLVKTEAEKIGLKLIAPKEDLFTRSDHYNFYKNGISAMDITSGLHKDYHTVRDNPETIDPEKIALISQLIFRSAWIITNEETYYKTVKLK